MPQSTSLSKVMLLCHRLCSAHPSNGEEGCVLEVFNAVGDSIAVIVVPLSAIEKMPPNTALSLRPLVESKPRNS